MYEYGSVLLSKFVKFVQCYARATLDKQRLVTKYRHFIHKTCEIAHFYTGVSLWIHTRVSRDCQASS